jgi:hypothetical protein
MLCPVAYFRLSQEFPSPFLAMLGNRYTPLASRGLSKTSSAADHSITDLALEETVSLWASSHDAQGDFNRVGLVHGKGCDAERLKEGRFIAFGARR